MFERSYPVSGLTPIEAMRRLLDHFRDRERRHTVSLGCPPFERDELNRITAVRLCFTPRTLR